MSDVEDTSAPNIDTARFRQVLGHFPTGVTIVTGLEGSDPVGLTCGAFFSISLDPPLVGFCADKSSKSWPRIQPSGRFCVNVLGQDQEDVSRVFATSGADKFSGLGWKKGSTGSPIINDVLAWIECTIDAEHEAGDHTVVVGRVVELHVGDEPEGPLLFYRGGYGRFEA
jgi:flavin reductase (DIM6/NTAB) family NADH-FMN oxidoreductase RutF